MGADVAWTDGPTLSVWIYDSPRGAAAGKLRLERLSHRGAVTVLDAATVTWIRGAHRPRIGRPHARTVRRASHHSCLHVLLEQLIASGQGGDDVSALARRLRRAGLSEEFLRELREALTSDSSVLLVLSLAADFDEVQAVIERGRTRGDVRYALVSLSKEQLAELRTLARARHAEEAQGARLG